MYIERIKAMWDSIMDPHYVVSKISYNFIDCVRQFELLNFNNNDIKTMTVPGDYQGYIDFLQKLKMMGRI